MPIVRFYECPWWVDGVARTEVVTGEALLAAFTRQSTRRRTAGCRRNSLRFRVVGVAAHFCWAVALAFICMMSKASGDELLGAEKALGALARGEFAPGGAPAPVAEPARAKLQADLDQFRANQARLSPEKAAQDWLALVERFLTLPPAKEPEARSYYSYPGRIPEGLNLPAFVAALPGPASWPHLARILETDQGGTAVEKRRRATLRLLAAFLNGDPARTQTAFESLEAFDRSRAGYGSIRQRLQPLATMIQSMQQEAGSNGVVAAFEKLIEARRAAPQGTVMVNVPDLVTLAGEQRAAQLIGKALDTRGVRLVVPGGPATLKLAQQLALQKVGSLPEPPWGLVAPVDGVELYEALAKRFPEKSKHESESVLPGMVEPERGGSEDEQDQLRLTAQGYYVSGLLAAHRTADAVRAMRSLTSSSRSYYVERMWRTPPAEISPPVLWEFYDTVLRQDPSCLFWEEYLGLSTALKRTGQMNALLKSMAENKDLTPAQRWTFRVRLANGLLAADQVDQAAAVIKDLAGADPATVAGMGQGEFLSQRMAQGNRLVQLGKLLDRKDWFENGLQLVIDAGDRLRQSKDSSLHVDSQLVEVLVDGGRFAEAEKQVLQVMAARLSQPRREGRVWRAVEDENAHDELAELARIYNAAGRHADVLVLLERAPWWGAADLAGLGSSWSERCGGIDLPSIAAEALHAAGRDPEAIRILEWHLVNAPGNDRPYKLLLEIRGQALIPWLDTLYARDRFEERPLIWKTVLQIKAGQLDAAETTIRQALQIDPTDGEEPAGDRARAYGVLADVLTARGKPDDAKFFRNVLESVRVAETGDEYTAAGLVTRSLGIYEKAQALFANAYCVQWRLAERLAATGDRAGAEEHYRIAFERMPEQFGQVANFCFGCEGVFDKAPTRSMAERVLLRLDQQIPKRPQVDYLLGQLREAENRYVEACAYYRKAVDLDPDYLDAWAKIHELRDHVFLNQAERDLIVLRMLKLAPVRHHHEWGEVADLKGLWTVLTEAGRGLVKPAETVLPLPASKKQIEAAAKERPADMPPMDPYQYQIEAQTIPAPGAAIATHPVIHSILELLEPESDRWGGAIE